MVSNRDALPPRRLHGAQRRLRALAALALFSGLAMLVLWSSGSIGKEPILPGLHLTPALLALAAAMLLAPPSGERLDRNAWARCLGAASVVGTLGAVLAAFDYERWRWLGGELFYAEWMNALGELWVPALLVSLLLHALVPIPFLLVRWRAGDLEWQCGGAAVSGLLALVAISGDQMLAARFGQLSSLFAFMILGVGSYWTDRWVDPGREPPRPSVGVPAIILMLSVVGSLLSGSVIQGVARVTLHGIGFPQPSQEIEDALDDCSAALTDYRQQNGEYPASLGELPGIDPDMAAGLKAGYIIRYGQGRRSWSLAADPLPEIGKRKAFYLLRSDQGLESRDRPYGLTLW